MSAAVEPIPDDLVARVKEDVAFRKRLGDSDPESGHADIDGLCELVARAVAARHPQATDAALLVVDLLEVEDREGWTRWYA